MEPELVPASDQAIARAARLLCDGGLVAFPTETVYGLGADATSEAAVARIFAAKGRPRFNPLIVHVPGLAEAEALAVFDERARRAARRFWPGPLSLVLRRRAECGLSLLASAGLDTVALRAPAHAVAQALLPAAGPPGEALLAFGHEAMPGFAEVLFLSRTGDLAEAAANLFAMLRRVDRAEFSGIAVMPIPDEGLGRAINDRLHRAAALKQ